MWKQKKNWVAITLVGLSSTMAVAQDSKIKVNGDFRYRHQEVDQEYSRPANADRLRARAALSSQINEQFSAGMRIASGINNAPTGTLDTMDTNFTKKSIYLDQAWASWALGSSLPTLSVGKVKNPFVDVGETGLVLDGDVNPEGAAATWSMSGVFAKVAHFVVDDDTNRTNSDLNGVQLGYDADVADGMHLTVGASYFDFTNSKQGVFGAASGNTTNTLAGATYNKYDYNLMEAFARFDWNVGAIALALYADYVQNDDPSKDEEAWVGGALAKFCEKAWTVGYDYRENGKDAVVGYFNDSDFAGGGTDNRGHRAYSTYKVNSNVSFGLTYFYDKQLTSTTNSSQRNREYQRAQFDATFVL